jgi:phosphoribosyl-AMP cyclohydrolase
MPPLFLDFGKLKNITALSDEVVPVVVQHAETKDVLILAYANRLAINESIKTRIATFWSTSRNELWVKGSTSGNSLALVDIKINCDQNSLLYLVIPNGSGVCHVINDATGLHYPTCFHRSFDGASV